MAFQQQFSDRLLQQVSEVNNRNLHLESMLAQKDDQIAHLQRTLANQHSSSPSVPGVGIPPHGYELQLHKANERAATAEETLKNSIRSFDKEYKSWQKQIKALKAEVAAAGSNANGGGSRPASAPPLAVEGGARVVALQSELAKTKGELQKLRSAYQGLQRQFQAEKRENARLARLPRMDPGKGKQFQQDDDEDDEEPNAPWIKQEPGTGREEADAEVSVIPPRQPVQASPAHQSAQRETSPSSMPIRRASGSSNAGTRRVPGRGSIDADQHLQPSPSPKPSERPSFADTSRRETNNKRRRRSNSSDINDSSSDSDTLFVSRSSRKRSRRSHSGSASHETAKRSSQDRHIFRGPDESDQES